MNLHCQINSFAFPGSNDPFLQNLHFQLRQGTITLLQGTSGSGKSTLCRIICGVYPQVYEAQLSGKITFDQKNISGLTLAEIGTMAGVVLQDPESQLFMPTVAHEIAFGLESLGLETSEIKNRIDFWTNKLDIKRLYSANPKRCSGGEKQAIILAAVLAMDRPIIIMDEPCSQLDTWRRAIFQKILTELKKQEKTILLVSHQDELAYLADQQLFLHDGSINRKGQDVS